MVSAALAALCFVWAGYSEGTARVIALVLAAVFVQGRLLCNLFDGMVAMEAGKKEPDGVAWNEFPDRFADVMIMVGLGYSVNLPALGWAAATFSVLTAYVRELSAASGQGHDFCGPMAKQHRMAVVTIAAVVALWGWPSFELPLVLALWLVTIGSLVTSVRRVIRLVVQLQKAH